jgi:hypothetical protein
VQTSCHMPPLETHLNAKLYERLCAIEPSSKLEYTGNLAYWCEHDKKLPLQSKRHPEKEAQNLASHWIPEIKKAQVITLVGVSHYFIIEALLQRLPANSHIIIVEPNLAVLATFLKENLLPFCQQAGGIHIISEQEPDHIMLEFRRALSDIQTFCTGIYTPPTLLRIRPELKETTKLLSRALKIDAMDRGTIAAFSDEWLQNSILNLPELIQSPGVSQLQGKFKNRDAFVICAGPSLNDSLQLIKKQQHSSLIICVGTALKPLLAAGIKPHITIIVDSDPIVYKQFEGIDSPPGHLLCSYTIFPGIVQKFKEKLIAFNCIVSKDFSDWLNTAQLSHAYLNVGGTVSLSALDLARILNCKNIFTCGLDLAYAEDGTSHAKNSMYDNNKTKEGLVKVKGNRHKYVQTTKQFAGYIDIMNNFLQEKFSDYKGKLYNVNNSGAKFTVMELITPEECQDKCQLNGNLENLNEFLAPQELNCETFKALCESSITELQEIKNESHEILEQLKKDEIPQSLEAFEIKVKESPVCTQLLNQALQAWCMNVAAGSENDPIKLTKSFITQINGAADWVSGLLESSLERFIKQKQGV